MCSFIMRNLKVLPWKKIRLPFKKFTTCKIEEKNWQRARFWIEKFTTCHTLNTEKLTRCQILNWKFYNLSDWKKKFTTRQILNQVFSPRVRFWIKKFSSENSDFGKNCALKKIKFWFILPRKNNKIAICLRFHDARFWG